MGIVRDGIPRDLTSLLRNQFSIKAFVETGTYYAETATWASKEFDQVWTIEFAKALYDQAVANFSNLKNIHFLYGNSRTCLDQVVGVLTGPALYWLDAHWSEGVTYGEKDQCPLIDEIKTIDKSKGDAFLLIDDARLFLSPGPKPHVASQWPDIHEVIEAIIEGDPSRYIVIIEDVIVAVPARAKQFLIDYCQMTNAPKPVYRGPVRRAGSWVKRMIRKVTK